MAWRRKIHFSSRRVFTCLMFLSAAMLLLPGRFTDGVDHVVTLLTAPFTSSSRQMSLAVLDKMNQPGKEVVDAEQYRLLEKQYRRDHARLVNLNEQVNQLEQLIKTLSGLRQKFGLARANLIVTQVIGNTSTNWQHAIMLDRGSLDRVQSGQIVLGPVNRDDPIDPDEQVYSMCVVGRIKKAGLKTSDVQMMTDPGFSLPVSVIPRWDRNQDWRAEGILQGQGMGRVQVGMVAVQDHPIQVGDIVLACSQPDYLPVEMLAAVVIDCKRDDENPLMWRIEVKPGANLNAMDQLIIVESLWGRRD